MFATFLSIGGIIFLILYIAGKRILRKEEQQAKDFLLAQARDLKSVKLPKNYFKILFMGWMDKKYKKKISDNEKMETFQAMKEAFTTIDDIKTLIESAEYLDNNYYDKKIVPTLFDTPVEWDIFKKEYNQSERDEYIAKDIIYMLPIIASTKNLYESALDLGRPYNADVLPYTTGIPDMFPQVYMKIAEFKWNELCAVYPQLNKEERRAQFFNYIKNDDVAKKAGEAFFVEAMMAVDKECGGGDWLIALAEVLQTLQEKHERAFDLMKNPLSPYSSIHEIDDFSKENTDRIVELYKTKQITGVYSKAKDPKYRTNR